MASLVCATCRKLIPPGTSAIRCTVASCNTGRLKLRFCSVSCWEKHVPTARHRKAAYSVETSKAPDEENRTESPKGTGGSLAHPKGTGSPGGSLA
jgi:LSD1 subclass zinc finger protein